MVDSSWLDDSDDDDEDEDDDDEDDEREDADDDEDLEDELAWPGDLMPDSSLPTSPSSFAAWFEF